MRYSIIFLAESSLIRFTPNFNPLSFNNYKVQRQLNGDISNRYCACSATYFRFLAISFSIQNSMHNFLTYSFAKFERWFLLFHIGKKICIREKTEVKAYLQHWTVSEFYGTIYLVSKKIIINIFSFGCNEPCQ